MNTTLEALRRRRECAHRLPPLDCGHADPYVASHRPGPNRWGYRPAAEHLAAAGLLPAMPDDLETLREMWRDDATRELAGEIAAGWAVAR